MTTTETQLTKRPRNRLLMGAHVEPVTLTRWLMSGPFGEYELALIDSGGWDLKGGSLTAPEHYTALNQALFRAYNLTMGYAKS